MKLYPLSFYTLKTLSKNKHNKEKYGEISPELETGKEKLVPDLGGVQTGKEIP